jgi:hypothetical protein
MSDWGKGVNNNIGWGQGADNDIGWGSIYDKSNAGETLLSGGGFEGFLNKFSGANLGLSLELLDKDYPGFCIKVRRSSDNAELDIGFVDEVLDIATLLTFVGSGDAFVTIIYDQVGSNNMTQTTANLQGQIVSNGSVILKGGKPCIIRSSDNDGGYLSTYAPNDGVAVKGLFYVGDNEGNNSAILGSNSGIDDFLGVVVSGSSEARVNDNLSVSNLKINGISKNFTTRGQFFTDTNNQFLIYLDVNFNFDDNVLGWGFRRTNPENFGMFTFQELVIFENTDDATAKQNNINARYNNIY